MGGNFRYFCSGGSLPSIWRYVNAFPFFFFLTRNGVPIIILILIPKVDNGLEGAEVKEFHFYIESDGAMASVIFHRRSHGKVSFYSDLGFFLLLVYLFVTVGLEYFPSTKSEFQMLPRSVDLSEWKRGIYSLEKEPIGLPVELLEKAQFLGADPGKKNFFFCILRISFNSMQNVNC